jgi:SAM-dependent methyltransferase
MHELRRLKESALLAYDRRPEVYVPFEQTYRGRSSLIPWIQAAFAARSWRFLDLGGGSGVLTDYLLQRFPEANGVLIDTSDALLSRNSEHPRKTLLRLSVEDIGAEFAPQSFDLICCHCLLHHIVDGSYRSSDDRVKAILASIRRLLSPDGRLSLWEPCYASHMVSSFASRMIFAVTSSKRLLPVCRRLGANTAGVGVRFLSTNQWETLLAGQGLRIVNYETSPEGAFPWYVRYPLLLKSMHASHFWCGAT